MSLRYFLSKIFVKDHLEDIKFKTHPPNAWEFQKYDLELKIMTYLINTTRGEHLAILPG